MNQSTLPYFSVPPAKFYKTHVEAIIPKYYTAESRGLDLHIIENVYLRPSDTKIVRTGLVAIPPKGYAWNIYLRSSIGKKYPGLILTNHVGIIDSDYSGIKDELLLSLRNNTDEVFGYNSSFAFCPPSLTMPLYIPKGERIAQLVLVCHYRPNKIIEITKEEIEHTESRGGFGSTG